jgi:hypothetical protein
LTSATRRRSVPRRSPDKGMARGWYQIGWSTDFPPGTAGPVHYFDCDLVAFRGTDSADGTARQVRVLDAFFRPPFLTTEAESMRAFRAWSAQWYQT